jgi:hypothetical protein
MQLDRDSNVLNSSLSVRPSSVEIEPLCLLTNLAALISTEVEQLIPPG